jgi:ketosteroid isomerase-like protein
MTERDVERLRRNYDAYNRGDWEAAMEQLAPDFVAKDRAELPDPRTYRGREGAEAAFQGAGEGFADYRIEPEEFIDLGGSVVVILRQSGRGEASGAPVEGTVVHLWRIGPDGRAKSLEAFSTREEALAAAGRSE